MKQTHSDWQLQSLDFNKRIHEVLTSQHLAAQYIALAGKYLAEQKPDDSNTNMRFIAGENLLLGNPISKGLQPALQLAGFKLVLLDSDRNALNEIQLTGKSQEEVFDALKEILAGEGVDVSNFSNKLHYDLPYDKTGFSMISGADSEAGIAENIKYRHNAEIVLNLIAKQFPDAEPVRIWPHHFDTGSYIPLEFNDKKEVIKSLGIGWAIPDSMVDEPYYYLSFWSVDDNNAFPDLHTLSEGNWMMPAWNGAVLKNSDISKKNTAESQFKLVNGFFTEAIHMLLKK